MTDFFLATVGDLHDTDYRQRESIMDPGLLDSDLDLLMLCNLESILTGSQWDNVFDEVYINPVGEQGPDGPWIYEVSVTLLTALQNLDREAISECAKQWAETDEWTLRQDTPLEQIAQVVHGLAGLAKRAEREGKSLFICTGL